MASSGFVATASKFRYSGTQHTNAIKKQIEAMHNNALQLMLITLVDPANWAQFASENGEPFNPNFTGETQATFRKFRDYLSKAGLNVELHDFTLPFVQERQFSFKKRWKIPAKIANLSNAGNVTAAGHSNIFTVKIQSKPFKIQVIFETGAFLFQPGEPLFSLWETAKAKYKEAFRNDLIINLFPFGAEAGLKKFFNRVQIRST